MKNTKTLEALVGGFVILGILGLIFLAYKVSSVNTIGKNGAYTLHANFYSVTGVKVGAPVTMAGVKIGQVKSIDIRRDKYDAHVVLSIDSKYDNIPLDSSISVLTQGLLGEKYLGLDAGAEVECMTDGDEFEFTKSAIVLERLIDQFLLKSSSNSSK